MFRRGMSGNARMSARTERDLAVSHRRCQKRGRSVPATGINLQHATTSSAPDHADDGTREVEGECNGHQRIDRRRAEYDPEWGRPGLPGWARSIRRLASSETWAE